MVDVIYAAPGDPEPEQRHVVLIVHRLGPPSAEKGYFYDSAVGDHGGSGPFDWLLAEAIVRAKRFAQDEKIAQVIIRAKAL
jgi:hypothetical protein